MTHTEANETLRELILTTTTKKQLMKIAELLEEMNINGGISIPYVEAVCLFEKITVDKKNSSIDFRLLIPTEAVTSFSLYMKEVENISARCGEGKLIELCIELADNQEIIFALNIPEFTEGAAE